MGVLAGLEPLRVFHYFEEICQIPHGSGNTKAISDYLAGFAREHGLRYLQDTTNNVVIFKEASKGYEDKPTVMLQGHMDMVCAKHPGVEHDFEKDGLRLAVDGDNINAQGTTLGGDDGIAVAYMLAILEADHIKHPALEAVITVDEEIGLLGAKALDAAELKSRWMINLDSEAEGVLTVGCAGGVRARLHLPVTYMEAAGTVCQVTVSGLLGGHSGAEIDKGRANANTMMGRVLYRLAECVEFTVASIAGGQADNAIPKSCEATLVLTADQKDEAEACVQKLQEELTEEFRSCDPDIRIGLELGEHQELQAFSYETVEKLIFLLFTLPNGVQRMSPDIEGLVQTSLSLGIVETQEDSVRFVLSIRSSLESEKQLLADKIGYMIRFVGGTVDFAGGYPGWAYRPDSALRELMVQVYREMYGQEPVVEAIHAGLECGLISAKLPGLDCISLGPDMKDIHTPDETLNIPSVKRVWNYLLKVLESC